MNYWKCIYNLVDKLTVDFNRPIMACIQSWYTGMVGAENKECRAVLQTDLTRSFVPSVAQTTLSKE